MTPQPDTATPPPVGKAFMAERRVRFEDCDPAGIVFYPRYFCMVNAVIEDWWAHIGLPWQDLMRTRRLVTPVSHVDTVFLRPSMLGEQLQFQLQVEALGRSSFRLQHRVAGPDDLARLQVRQRMVCASMDGHQPTAWPADIKAMLAEWAPQKAC